MSEPTVISRRDFLKTLGLLPSVLAAPYLTQLLKPRYDVRKPNVIIFVFDAWSAKHLSVFGYPRQTMPNFEKFTDRAFVFHNHSSPGSFTIPGTASLLTGLYPWSHGAMHLGAREIVRPHEKHNIFTALKNSFYTLGYSQNPYADIYLYQFDRWLDAHLSSGQFNLERHQLYNLPFIENDAPIAFMALDNNIFAKGWGLDGSLFIGLANRLNLLRKHSSLRKNYKGSYPKGLPLSNEYFLLDQTIDGSIEAMRGFTAPTLAYFHFLPPHAPYTPTKQYFKMFNDDWKGPEKPVHPLSQAISAETQTSMRQAYDQYLAAWDAEVARLLDFLETSGLLDTSIVIFTSDHGELFERGDIAHSTQLLADAVIHVPLLISLPGQNQRKDIHAFTSSVDVLPTIASLVGAESPAWVEGKLLPGLGGTEDPNRSIYSIDAKNASSFSALKQFSISLTKQKHRLIYYQYPYYSGFEFYDMESDPEELTDLYPSKPALSVQMKAELLQTIADFNRPYEK
jgi:arylsulfatase A-like enzyme